ncbi:hypothetical protein IWW47_001743, partial [Coemansia sp. RSA 2052]
VRAHAQRPVVHRQHADQAGLPVRPHQPGRGDVGASPPARAGPRHPRAVGQSAAAQPKPAAAAAAEAVALPAPAARCARRCRRLGGAPVHVADGRAQRAARAAQAAAAATHV